MQDLKIAAADLLSVVKPDTLLGALLYLLLFVLLALLVARTLRAAVHGAMVRQGHMDRTTISFLQQTLVAAIWVIALILYAHLIPALRSLGTALLAGASVASVVIGLAAQSTLGNLIAGVALTIYRPFRLGDTLQVAAPNGTETGTVELISLGYTTLRTGDGRCVVLPNALAASQATLNLSSSRGQPLGILIRVGRDSDLEAARDLALQVARETVDAGAVLDCLLTRIRGEAAILELRLHPPDNSARDALRSKLLAALARRFAQAGLDVPGAARVEFS